MIPIAGGVASFAEEGSPFNKVAGLGFGGVPGAAALDEIERAFAACGAPVQVELAHLADPAIGAFLTGRGYRLVSFENVLGRALTGRARASHATRDRGPAERRRRVRSLARRRGGCRRSTPTPRGCPRMRSSRARPWPRGPSAISSRRRASARYAALRDGIIVGGASFRLAEGIAQFTGAATAPAHRRRGIQTALLSARLADAAAAGCDIAVVTTQPGSKSQQNVQRRGFDLLYTRAVLVKQALVAL